MLADGVVTDTQDIDLCMILGAGWPLITVASPRTSTGKAQVPELWATPSTTP